MENIQQIMEQPASEQVEVTAVKEDQNESILKENIATSETDNGSIGKFKDVQSLLSAYNNLQAEFTRKCQKVSELENSLSAFSEKGLEEYAKTHFLNNPEMKNHILKSYLEELAHNATPTLISSSVGGGIPLKAPPKPTSLEEAKQVAKNLFK